MRQSLTSRVFGFALPWERGQDFCWSFARNKSGADGFDGIGANYDAAAVEPILDISLIRRPFKIVSSAVEAVLIFMMDDRKSKRVGNKGNSYETMDQQGFCFSIFSELYFRVASYIAAIFTDSGSDVAVAALTIINNAGKTKNPPKIANSIYTLISKNIAPLFPHKAVYGGMCLRKQGEDSFLYVENSSSGVGNQIAVISRGRNDLGLSEAPIRMSSGWRSLFGQLSQSALVRNLESIKFGNRQPLFVRHVSFPVFHKNQELDMPSPIVCQDSALASKSKGL